MTPTRFPMVSLRPATEQDCAELARIYNNEVRTNVCTFDTEEKTPEQMRDKLESLEKEHALWVACDGEAISAWGCITPWSPRLAYRPTVEMSIYVDEPYRRQKIGSKLMEALCEAARDKGYWTVLGRIAEGNRDSLDLCAKMGFFEVGTMREVGNKFGRRLDVVLVQKMLQENSDD